MRLHVKRLMSTVRRRSFNTYSDPAAVCTVVTHTCRARCALDELQVEIWWFVNEIKHSSARALVVNRRKPLPSDTRRSVILL